MDFILQTQFTKIVLKVPWKRHFKKDSIMSVINKIDRKGRVDETFFFFKPTILFECIVFHLHLLIGLINFTK